MKDPGAGGDSDSVECENDIRAVALAILRGLVSPEEGRSAVFGRTEPRPVSETLQLRPDLLAEAQQRLPAEADGLFKSLFEQPDPAALVREDETLARLLVAQQLIGPEQAEECLAIQRRLLDMGLKPVPRLGDLLVRKGYLAPGRLAAALPEQTPAEVLAAQKDPANCVGRYVRTRKLGEGGMGEVWRAWDRELSRWVALKFLKGKDKDELARFRREAQTAAKLSHPNIAAIYEAQDTFIAMQLVDGQTLATFPRDNLREVVQIVRDVALALHYAHEQGVIHRDVKPENVMIEACKPHRVWVMDFGLAKQMAVESKLSVSGMILGTPAYMSPEQAIGHRVDRRADVYSLGATLYELLADQPPFVAPDLYHTIRKILELDPKPPARDADLNTIVLKCLEKDPGRRYGTAQELADDLGRWLAGEPILAHPPSAMYRLRKKVGRNPWAWSLAGAAAMAVLVGLAAVVYLLSRGERKSRANELLVRIERLYNDDAVSQVPPLIEEALRIDPDNADARYWRSRLLLREYVQRRGVPEARVVRGLLEIAPPRPETDAEQRLRRQIEAGFGNQPLARGTLALWSGDYGRAVEEFARIPQDSPGAWEAEFYIGVAHYLRGDFENACAAMMKHMQKRMVVPVLVRSLLASGQAAELRGEDEVVEARYALALGLAKDSPVLESQVLVLRGKFEASRGGEPKFAKAIELVRDRTEPEARTALGDAWLALAEHRRFRGQLNRDDPEEYRFAVEAYGDSEPLRRAEAYLARYDVSLYYGRDGADDLRRACEDFERALRERPELVDAAVGLFLATRERRKGEGVPAYREAVDRLTELLRRHPENVTVLSARGGAHSHLAYALERGGQDPIPAAEAAVADYKHVLELRPNGEGYQNVGRALQELESFHFRRGDPRPGLEEEALQYLKMAVDANPKNYRARLSWAVIRGNQILRDVKDVERGIARYREILVEFDRALAVNPNHVESLRMRATYQVQLGVFRDNAGGTPLPEYTEALADLRRAEEINPNEPALLVDFAEVYRHIAEYRREMEEDETEAILETIRYATRAIDLNPRFASALCIRGKARSWLATIQKGGLAEHDAALDDLNRAVEVEKFYTYFLHRSEVRYSRIGALRALGRDPGGELEAALADALEALRLEGRHDLPHYQAGIVRVDRAMQMRKAGKDAAPELGLAEGHFTDAIERNGQFAKAFMYRGIVRRILERKAEAKADLLEALEIRPSLRPQVEPWLRKCD